MLASQIIRAWCSWPPAAIFRPSGLHAMSPISPSCANTRTSRGVGESASTNQRQPSRLRLIGSSPIPAQPSATIATVARRMRSQPCFLRVGLVAVA